MLKKRGIFARRNFALMLTVFLVASMFPALFTAQAAPPADNKNNSNYYRWNNITVNDPVRTEHVGNLNNEGNADLAVITNDHLLVLYYVASDGTFTRQPVTAKQADPSLERVHIEDLDDDQFGEVLVFSPSQVEIFGRNAVGSYELKSAIPLTSAAYSEQAIADFNKDGIKDLILVSSTKVHYLKGSASLTYTEVGSYTHQTEALYGYVHVKTGDWNKDGHLDFAYQLYQKPIVLFTGNGQFGFSHAKTLGLGYDFEAVDVNQDGFTDIIGRGGKYEVHYGDIGAQFARKDEIGHVTRYYRMFSTDVNADGYPDLILYDDWENYFEYVLWNRNGKFSVPEKIDVMVIPNQVVDFNGDGREDLVSYPHYFNKATGVALNFPFNGEVHFNQAEKEVAAHADTVQVEVRRTGGSSGYTLVEYDTLDGTAKAGTDYKRTAGSLAFHDGETVKTVSVPITTVGSFEGTRAFSVRLKYPTSGVALGLNRKINIQIRSNSAVPQWPNGAIVDIADATPYSMTAVWPQAQDQVGIESYEIKETTQAFAPVTVTKNVYSHTLKGLVPGKTYHVQVTAKNANGERGKTLSGHVTLPKTSEAPSLPSYQVNSVNFRYLLEHKYTLHKADSNGDGFDELIVHDGHGRTNIAQVLSDQTWQFYGRLPIEQCGRVKYSLDLNQDGKEEWLASGGSGICVTSENESGGYEQVTDIPLRSHYDYQIGDFTNDGINDIVYESSNELIMLQGSGNYAFTEVMRQPLAHTAYRVLSGDWNGDGHLDIAAYEGGYQHEKLHLYKNNGDRTFTKLKVIEKGTSPQAADFNKDGYTDIVAFHGFNTQQEVVVYYGNAQGSFDGTYRIPATEWIYEIRLADLNGDDDKDFVFVYLAGVEAVVNDGNGGFQLQGLYVGNMKFWYGSQYLIGDFNGDGKDDIASRLQDRGDLTVYDNLLVSGSLQFNHASQQVWEHSGYAQVKVKRVGDRSGVTSVVYGTEDGTGLAGVDYVASTGTLTFADGETEKTVLIPLLNNDKSDQERSFKVKLQSPTRGAKLGTHRQLDISIRDDDKVAPTWPSGAQLSVSDVTYKSFTLSWPSAIDLDGIEAYEILERNGALAPVTVAGNINSYTWATGLTPGKSYRLQVRAKDKKGLVSWPLQTCVTVQTCVTLPQPFNADEPIETIIVIPMELLVEPPLKDLPVVRPQWIGDAKWSIKNRITDR
ncbi:FG-GAP-like repeat-containing protein [Paenibacillus assamensis]|uniref:FG-GAP-like repeat-containing protein n=1 Tax=Paenibacillus assamensis TaxID=311244 RepID=UPI00041EB974|nr:FG-GAP-like repeat-containing protein [Paenibacillus assamensis]